ncbi:MAG: class I SAM-dependent DNA methyltransferase [Bacteroidota bacterium]
MLTPEIKSKINQLWDKFWSGGLSNPITAIEQISYLLFMKRLDGMEKEYENNTRSKQLKSIFSGFISIGKNTAGFKWLKPQKNGKKKVLFEYYRWSYFANNISDSHDKLLFVSNYVFPFIKTLNSKEFPFSKYMKEAVFMIPKPSLLEDAIKIIEEIHLEIENQQREGQAFHDTLGDVYEYLLNEIAQSGKNGQFRTPRHIIRMITEIVNPDISDKICDPTCGTGGFLVGAYQYIVTKYTSEKFRMPEDENGFVTGIVGDKIKTETIWKKLREQTFYGFDFDATMVRLGLMNLMLHDITHPNIEQMDTLDKRYDKYELAGQYSIILANPPFKGSIDESNRGELRIKSNKTELLFLDRIMRMLQNDGKAGVIIPDGVLFGGSNAHQEIRKLLLQTCELKAVISMPSGVFKPYAGVSTAVLIFNKKVAELKDPLSHGKNWHTQRVWFYGMQSDGYSLDDNRRSQNDKPLPGIVKKYNEYQNSNKKSDDRKKVHFYVPIKDIIANKYNLSFSRYREMDYVEVNYEPPKEILNKLIELENELLSDLKSLKEMIQ